MEQPLILIIGYNRADYLDEIVRLVMKENRPFLVSLDGPKNKDDYQALECQMVLNRILSLKNNFLVSSRVSETNLGCKRGVIESITWGFTFSESLIIIEDDIRPLKVFYEFMDWALGRFRKDSEVFLINGWSPNYALGDEQIIPYFRSRHFSPWGWGTWLNRWREYDSELTHYNKTQPLRQLPGLVDYKLNSFFEARMKYKLSQCQSGYDTWDYQLLFSMWRYGGKAITPTRRLTSNVGFDKRATHTRKPLKFTSEYFYSQDYKASQRTNSLIFQEVSKSASELDYTIDKMTIGFNTRKGVFGFISASGILFRDRIRNSFNKLLYRVFE